MSGESSGGLAGPKVKVEGSIDEILYAENVGKIIEALSDKAVRKLIDKYGARLLTKPRKRVLGGEVGKLAYIEIEGPVTITISAERAESYSPTLFTVEFDFKGRSVADSASHVKLSKALTAALKNLEKAAKTKKALVEAIKGAGGDDEKLKELEEEAKALEETIAAFKEALA